MVEKGHLFTLESVNDSALPEHLRDVRRGKVHEFTRQSRNRLIREISSYGKLVPIFITLTYGADYPSARESKKHLEVWWKRILRDHPEYWAVWKLEFQERGAPHYHLLVYCEANKPRIPKEVIARYWSEVVGDPSIEKTATRVESLRSHRGGIWYATKYLAKVEVKGEQAEAPDTIESTGQGEAIAAPVGRFWGVLARKNRPKSQTVHRLSPSEYKVLLYDVVRQCAKAQIQRERRTQGWTFEECEAVPIEEDEESSKMKEILEKSKVPVHLMSDETSFIDRIARLSRDSFFVEQAEKIFG